MKYTCEIVIDLPRDRVLELFKNREFNMTWQEGLKSMELLEGESYKTGAVTRYVFDSKGRDFEIVETILDNESPEIYDALYTAKNAKNWWKNRLIDKGDQTQWISYNIFEMSGIMWFVSLFGKRMFVNKTMKDMKRFKELAENYQFEL